MNDLNVPTRPAGVLAWYSSFDRPDQVVDDPFLSQAQKRELLADWASDRRAIPDKPNLRRSRSGATAPVSEILLALKRLDGAAARLSAARPRRLRDVLPYRSKLLFGEAIRVRRRRRGVDNEPPPVPAAARVPQPPPSPP